jgi:hypothetical protein
MGDELFEEPGTQAPASRTEGAPQAQSPDYSDALEQIRQDQQTLHQNQTQIAEYLGQMSQQLQNLNPDQQQQVTDALPAGAQDLATRLLADPKSVMKEAFTEHARETLAPAMLQTINALSERAVQDAQRDFDAEYGEGKFAELAEKEFKERIDKLPYEGRVDASAIRSIMDAIKGRHLDALSKAKLELQTAKQTEEANVAAARTLPPGGTRPRQSELSANDRQLLKELDQLGFRDHLDPARLSKVRQSRSQDGTYSIENFPFEEPTNLPGAPEIKPIQGGRQ